MKSEAINISLLEMHILYEMNKRGLSIVRYLTRADTLLDDMEAVLGTKWRQICWKRDDVIISLRTLR